MSQSLDKYSDSVGHLIMSEDGAITNVCQFSIIFFHFLYCTDIVISLHIFGRLNSVNRVIDCY